YRNVPRRHTPPRPLAPDEAQTPRGPGFSRWSPPRSVVVGRGLQIFHPVQVAPATVRTQGRILARQPRQPCLPVLALRRDGRRRLANEELAAPGEVARALSVGQQPVVADAHETLRQHVEEKPADEFLGRQGHLPPSPTLG